MFLQLNKNLQIRRKMTKEEAWFHWITSGKMKHFNLNKEHNSHTAQQPEIQQV